jgi:hypothetical protein
MTTVTQTTKPSIRLVALASLVGTSIEWYDFFLYNTAAALVFNKLFFPNFDPFAGTMLSFATYAVGFAARPSAPSSSVTTGTRSAADRCSC